MTIKKVLKVQILLSRISSAQTRCIVKARLRKVHFSGDFLEVFDFLRSAYSLEFHKKTFKFNKIRDFYKVETPL